MNTRALALFLMLLSVTSASSASAPVLEPITDELACSPSGGAGEFGWVLRAENQPEQSVCIFAQYPDTDSKTPFVLIAGKKISLRLYGQTGSTKKQSLTWSKTEKFLSPDGRTRIILRYRLERDSCLEVPESCCGQQYDGEIEVHHGETSKRYRVMRWSGA